MIVATGTGSGADTAVLTINEIICKPLETKLWPADAMPNIRISPEPA
jgi:hypothetical protein